MDGGVVGYTGRRVGLGARKNYKCIVQCKRVDEVLCRNVIFHVLD